MPPGLSCCVFKGWSGALSLGLQRVWAFSPFVFFFFPCSYRGNQHEVLERCARTVVVVFPGGIRSCATLALFLH